ncbi:MAG: carbohydrate ABC transporter permease [Christensenellales bacterium]|jgi:putative aldouronate transport system permease protein|uniref:Carbohydrate ABC transporter permease n=1 Tax=Candidatus Avichristensenella intestinipullorum TaxID=2840693 RepID=A0A9D0YXY8_9FIRM|nr:carbohydrate ABC transporter permease [Christensenellales bacterium]HIQ62910.1 carbohydrate ABC transporter permease [Candidatus Avichristensenella intestinipullorum]
MKSRSAGDRLFDIGVYVLLTIAMLIVLYPLYFVVIASVSDPMDVLAGKVIWKPSGFSLEAYRMVFKDSQVMTGYRNTIAYTLAGTALNIMLSIAAAYPLSRRNLKGKGLVMGMMVFTMFFSGGLIPTYITISNLGLLNTFAVMILPTAISVYNVMIMRTFFMNSIPYELEEAAYVDGATHFRTLYSVVLPLSKPILAVMVLFYAIAHWNSYFNAMIYLSDKERYPLQLVLRTILVQSQSSEEILADVQGTFNRMLMSETIKYALIIVASVPVLCLYPFLQKYFVQGVMIGSVKG